MSSLPKELAQHIVRHDLPLHGPIAELEFDVAKYYRFDDGDLDSLTVVRKSTLQAFTDNSGTTTADLPMYGSTMRVSSHSSNPVVLFNPPSRFATLSVNCRTTLPYSTTERRTCTFELLKPGTQYEDSDYNSEGEFHTRYLFVIRSLKLINPGSWHPTAEERALFN
jgi:hypothetical protein